MTDQQINQRIAEACGWTEIETYGCHQRGWRPVAKEFGDDGKSFVPDYCNDLNAMHEAEKVLRPSSDLPWCVRVEMWRKWERYVDIMDRSLGSGDKIHATARQRAEAFLRTLGKWEDAQ